MGLFDFIKGEFIEVIEYIEDDKDIILWKFPDRDNEIKYGAQLTVRESQTAIFLDEGQFGDVYEPGRHKLITDNMPILTTLKSWKYGFESPFKADAYFLSTRTFPGLKWGTPNPIILRDPQFKQVRVKAFGTYFIRVKDPKKFFTEYAGTGHVVRIGEIEAHLRDIVSPKFAEAIAEAGVSVMDMVANYTELGNAVAPVLQQDLEPFGLELVKFQITSTSLPKEVEAFYDKMTNMNMVDNMNKFQQFQMSNAVEESAKNPSGGNAGVDMGVGMGMAQMFMNQMGQNQNQNQNPQQNQQQQNQSGKAVTRDEIMDTLKGLGELKAAGILTDEEFNAKKTELLARL
jgi:membrane protease subunit (stomatin/prohibitin family)